jgi:hypothetical protein
MNRNVYEASKMCSWMCIKIPVLYFKYLVAIERIEFENSIRSPIRRQLIQMSDEPDRNKKNYVNSCVRVFQTVLRAVGETKTTQGSVGDWLELDGEDPKFQLSFCSFK